MSSETLGIGKLPGHLLAELLASYPLDDPSVIVGPGVGMDAAAINPGTGLVVVKTDPITFVRDRAPYYLVNVNANDLACMGATPRWLLVTALLPAGKTTKELVQALFEELHEVCALRSISVVGGHTEITEGLDRPILVGHLLGTVEPAKLLRPGGSKPGDRILLTRPVAIEGTALLAAELHDDLMERLGPELLGEAAGLLHDPGISVVDDARALLETGVVSALHDPTEGGLATGVRELAMASGTGALVSRAGVPVLPQTRDIAAVLDIDPLGMLASGSLLATVPAHSMEAIEVACLHAAIPYAWIGKMTPAERGLILRDGDAERDLPAFDTDEVARALAMHRASR